jgi:type I restriction enzyme R subunit
MRFLADAGISPKTVEFLRRLGHDAIHVRIQIEDTLDDLPRAYGKELYETKCATLFEHVYEAYQGDGGSVFSDAAA